MAHTPTPPGGPPPRNKAGSVQPSHEEYGDFEGDPTSINNMQGGSGGGGQQGHQQGHQPQGTPRPQQQHVPPQMQFASPSPQLTHVGGPQQLYGQAPAYAPNQGAGMTEFSPMVSGTIAQA